MIVHQIHAIILQKKASLPPAKSGSFSPKSGSFLSFFARPRAIALGSKPLAGSLVRSQSACRPGDEAGYCLYLKGLDGIKDNYKPIVYTKKYEDEDISEKFIKHLEIITHSIYRKYYLNPKPLKLTPEKEKDFKSARVCHICEQEFGVYEKNRRNF